MPEPKSRFLDKILEPGADDAKSYGKERQLTSQAFNLHVERRDGRHSEGFGWSHYLGYRWTDEGDRERLVVLFGARAVEIEGHNLGVLVGEIREGQLNSIRELATSQVALKQANADAEPVIRSVNTYPDFDDLFNEIKGEDHETRNAGRAGGR